MELTLTATEFKAKCLELFDRLSSRKLDRITVTKRGKPVAVIASPKPSENESRSLIGSMNGSVTIPEGLDLTAPTLDEPTDAERGVLHR